MLLGLLVFQKMVRRCAVSWCDNHTWDRSEKRNLTYFKVPTDKFEEWSKILGCNISGKNVDICEKHFSNAHIKSYVDMCDKSGKLVQRVSTLS